jgi:uroporphyrinogen-III synthase
VRKLLLLRPEPGLTASAERARQLGLEVVSCPLFRVEPVAWEAPDLAHLDGLLLTSANAIRHGGPAPRRLTALRVYAVGEATASAARAAGFAVEHVGRGGLAELLADIPPSLRLLHLAGADHRDVSDPRIERRIVYRAVAIEAPSLPGLGGLVIAVHSPRAGSRLAELVADRGRTVIAAISAAAADACGEGWERVEIAANPDDDSLLALASLLCHTSTP